MRKWILIVTIVAVAALGYGAWPFVGMAQLASAVHSRDLGGILERVDVPAVRRSILTQVLDEGTRDSDLARKLGPLGRRAAIGLIQSVLDKEFSRFLDEDSLRTILSEGQLPDALQEELKRREPAVDPGGFRFASLPENPLRHLQGWRFRSPITFEATLGEEDRPGEWVTLRLRRVGTVWRLTNIELPKEIVARIKPLVQERLHDAGM